MFLKKYSSEVVLESEKFLLVSPQENSSNGYAIFNKSLIKNYKEVRIYYINNIFVNSDGIIHSYRKVYNKFLIWPFHNKEFNTLYLLKKRIKNKIIVLNNKLTGIVIFNYWSMGYFHWFCDLLPKLILIKNKINSQNPLILCEKHKTEFICKCLEIFEINFIFWIPDNSTLKCKSLITIDNLCDSGDHRPKIMHLIKNNILNFYKIKPNRVATENIYISRENSKNRCIENESEVKKLLKKYDFTIIHFEKLNFEQQIEICSKTKNYIGLHGANLMNLIFMPPNSNVLEITDSSMTHADYYFTLSQTFKINYHYLFTEKIEKKQNTLFFTVDTRKLEELVIKLLGSND